MQFPTDSATDVSSEPDKKGSNLSKVLCAQLWQSDILSVNTALSCLMCILNFNFHSVCQGSVADKIMSPFYFKLTINLVHFKVLLCFSKRLRTARHTFITNYPPGCNFKNTFLLQVGSIIFFPAHLLLDPEATKSWKWFRNCNVLFVCRANHNFTEKTFGSTISL